MAEINNTKGKKKKDAEQIGTSKELYNFIYEACNIIRGPVSQDSFKEYVTPLLYFKRISDVYDEEIAEALEQSGNDMEFASLPEMHRFVIPEDCHWEDIRTRSSDYGFAILTAMRKIELANPDTLWNVLSVFATSNWGNKNIFSDARLKDLLEHMSKRRLGLRDYNNDLVGDAYEMLLKKFADLSKAKAGEFYTPRAVVKLLIRILDPKPGESVYDPACGSGGMLIEAINYMKNNQLCCGKIFGQEKNVTNAAVSKMNLYLHGANDFNIMCGDTLRNPMILQNEHIAHFDCVVANPPFSLENWGAEAWKTDKYGRNFAGSPTDSNGDFAWLQHMICSMHSITGRLAVVLPQGVLFRGGVEKNIRQQIIDLDYIESIITLGDKLFYGTGLSPCIIVIRARKPESHRNRIQMIDASRILTVQRAQNILSDDDVDTIYNLYQNYADVEDRCKIVDISDIRDADLSPNKYVDYHKEDAKPYSQVMAEFMEAYNNMRTAEARFREILNIAV